MRVMALAPHPDDETLSAGGTLLRHRAAGDEVFWCVVTKAWSPRWSDATRTVKAAEVARVAEAYGAALTWLDFPSTRLDVIEQGDLMEAFAAVLACIRPDVLYTCHPGDVHSDHAATFRALLAVLKPWAMRDFGVRRLLAGESLSSTDAAPPHHAPFVPTVFHDIGATLERKLAVLALYASEAKAARRPAAVRALAQVRGATAGCEAAEAFALVREIG